jgi:hypothetical protein
MENLIIISSHVFIIIGDKDARANLDKPMQPARAARYRRGRSTT